MKSCPYRLNDYLSVNELLAALHRACRGKLRREEITWARTHMLELCTDLYVKISNGEYRSNRYYSRIIREPKKRIIYSLPIDDRVVHQFLAERYLRPWFINHLFIPNTYACIPNRGSHAAANRVRHGLRSAYHQYGKRAYVVQIDISKFFPSINRDILWNLVDKTFRCKDLKALLHKIIFDVSDPDITGLPIGNLTSQFLANAYLSSLDRLVAEGALREKYRGIIDYIRYMDDIVVIVDSKETAKALFAEMEQYLTQTLRLKINGKSNYHPIEQGVNFCGYITFYDKRFIRKRGKTAMKRIIRAFERGEISEEKFIERARACWGHMQHADSWNFATKHLAPYAHLFDFRQSKSETKKAARARASDRKAAKLRESWDELQHRLQTEWQDHYDDEYNVADDPYYAQHLTIANEGLNEDLDEEINSLDMICL
jgi:retron-type reverse transcriptase